jgi:hypothetical protein
MNPYTVAYAIGYFYGRSYSADTEVSLPEHDLYHKGNQGFTDGLAAGKRDFEEVDLPIIAMQEPNSSITLGEGVTLKNAS